MHIIKHADLIDWTGIGLERAYILVSIQFEVSFLLPSSTVMASSQDNVGRVIPHKDYFLRGGDMKVLVSASA